MVSFAHLLMKAYPTQSSSRFYNRIRDSRCNLQMDEVKRLMALAGVPENRSGTIDDIYLYEDILRTAIVVLAGRAGNRRVYAGSPKYTHKIFLYHSGRPNKGHFDTIVKINA